MKKILIVLLLVGVLIVSGCEQLDLSKISEEDINKVIVCEAPYIRHATGCCLDNNENKVCDKDEGVEQQTQTPSEEQPTTQPKETTPDPPQQEKISCSDIMFVVNDVTYSDNIMSVTVENPKELVIDSFLMEITGSHGADSVTISEGLGELDIIRTFSFEFDKSAIGIVKKVNIIPKPKINGNLFYCSEQKVVWYLETPQEPKPIPQPTSSLDLADFPEPFVKDGTYNENTRIVVGSGAPASDTMGAVDIATIFQYESRVCVGDTCTVADITPETMLSSEINNPEDYNLVIVASISPLGDSCPDTLLEKFVFDCGKDWTLESGEAIIQFMDNGEHTALVIAGTDAIDTRMAVELLKNYKDYSDLKGNKVVVTGTLSLPTIA